LTDAQIKEEEINIIAEKKRREELENNLSKVKDDVLKAC